MKIALVQFEVKINQSYINIEKRVEKFIKLAAEQKTEIICFPEDFWFGSLDYYDNKLINEITTTKSIGIKKWLCEKAKTYRINIIAGTLIMKTGNNFFNTCVVINKKGRIVLAYKKQKLVPYGFERRKIIPGTNSSSVINLSGLKVGVLICRELFYQEMFKKLRCDNAKIIFIPSFWSKRSNDYLNNNLSNNYQILSEMRVVDSLCQARSFENEIVICFVNACGKLKKENDFDILMGRTQVCLPFYGCYKKINKNKEDIIIFDYDANIINDARKAYKLY